MLSAIERGRPPSVEFLNGEVVTRGAALGVPTPINAAIRDQVLAIAAGKAKSSHALLRAFFDRTRDLVDPKKVEAARRSAPPAAVAPTAAPPAAAASYAATEESAPLAEAMTVAAPMESAPRGEAMATAGAPAPQVPADPVPLTDAKKAANARTLHGLGEAETSARVTRAADVAQLAGVEGDKTIPDEPREG
jgi:hypothetical protein